MKTKELMHKIELFIDSIIPHLVFIIFILIILELVFYDKIEPYAAYVTAVDYIIIGIFGIDLAFKYAKVRKIPTFLRQYWIDIIAVFPFFLIFRLFYGLYSIIAIPSLLTEPQTLIHESVVLEREGLRLIKAAEKAERVSRTRMLFRFLRPLARLPRLVKIVPYFERPTPEHHKIIKEIGQEKKKSK